MSRKGNSGFVDRDRRFGAISADTKGMVEVRQHFLERTKGRFAPVTGGTETVTGSTQIGSGTTDSENAPLRPYYDFAWSGLIFTPAEVGSVKTITAIAFDVSSFVSRQGDDINDVRVFCGHYNSSTFATGSPDEDIGSYVGITDWTQVTDNGYVWLPQTVGINDNERIIFDTTFEYNGVDNLMIKLENREGSYLDQPRIQWDSYTDTASVAYDWQDGTYPTGNGVRTNVRPNIVIYYEEQI